MEPLAPLTELVDRALEIAQGATATRGEQLAELARSVADDVSLAHWLQTRGAALEEQGASALLFTATARPAGDPLRQAVEDWLVRRRDKAPAWLRYVEGSLLSSHAEPTAQVVAHAERARGLAAGVDGSFWTWGGKAPGEVRRWDLSRAERLAHARSSFLLEHGEANADGWLAVGCASEESVVDVWDGSGKRLYHLDTRGDFTRPRWLRGSAPRALLVADGELSVYDLETKKPRQRWQFLRLDSNAIRPIKHAAPMPNGEQAVALEIDWNDVGAARALFFSLTDGKLARKVELSQRFAGDDSGNFAVSPDGRWLAFASDLASGRGAFVIDVESGATRHHFAPEASLSSLCFGDDHALWCGTRAGLVLRCDLRTLGVSALRASSAAVVGLLPQGESVSVLSADSRLLRYPKSECRFEVHELAEAEPAYALWSLEREPRALVFCPGKIRQVSEGDAHTRDLAPAPHLDGDLKVDADGRYVAAARRRTRSQADRDESELVLLDLSLVAPPRPPPIKVAAHARALLVAREQALFAIHRDERLLLAPFDGREPSEREGFAGSFIEDACLCPATNELACAVRGVGVVLLNPENFAESHTLYASPTAANAVLAVGQHLIALFVDGTLRIFALAERELTGELGITPSAPTSRKLAFLAGSASSDRAVAASGAGPALLFSPSTATVIATLGEAKTTLFARMSRDGDYVSTVDKDARLLVSETTRGQPVVSHQLPTVPRDVVWLGSRELLLREQDNHVVRLRLEL